MFDAIKASVEDVDANCRGPRLLWPADAYSRRLGVTSPTKGFYAAAAGTPRRAR